MRALGTLLGLYAFLDEGEALAQSQDATAPPPASASSAPSSPASSSTTASSTTAPPTTAPPTAAPPTAAPPTAAPPTAAPPTTTPGASNEAGTTKTAPSKSNGSAASGSNTPSGVGPALEAKRERRPSPLQVDYAQYGLGLGGDINLTSGRICPPGAFTPCILGSGGGLGIRGGYRPSGPWYFGAAYQFSKLDSNNLFRLGIFQQLRGEMRYFVDFGSRVTPYVEWGVGGVIYGNEWGADTGGAMAMAGGGIEFEITRAALVGLDMSYDPVLLAGYTDTTGQKRETGISQFLRLELRVELRTELGRE